MKNLILSVFAVVLSAFAFDIVEADQIMPVVPEAPQATVESMTWKIRKGENLTRIAERYNLQIKDILEANAGSKCIKTTDKILRGCKIAIPVAQIPQVKVYETKQVGALEKATDIVRAEGENKSYRLTLILIAGVGVVIVLVVLIGLSASATNQIVIAKTQLKQKNEELSSKLWTAEDKIRKMESFIPGHYIELQSRENGKIKAKIIKVRLGKNGELEVCVACPAEEHCLVNASENLKLENALSHMYKQHGTSQDLQPNGWTE